MGQVVAAGAAGAAGMDIVWAAAVDAAAIRARAAKALRSMQGVYAGQAALLENRLQFLITEPRSDG